LSRDEAGQKGPHAQPGNSDVGKGKRPKANRNRKSEGMLHVEHTGCPYIGYSPWVYKAAEKKGPLGLPGVVVSVLTLASRPREPEATRRNFAPNLGSILTSRPDPEGYQPP
jgi:hypothetical protein